MDRKRIVDIPSSKSEFSEIQKILRMIRSTPFFHDVTQEEFEKISGKIIFYQVPSETDIIHEKEVGDSLFFVTEGVMRATVKSPDGKKTILLTKLEKGNFFGEYSLLTGRLRSATITSITDAKLLEIPRKVFDSVALKYSSAKRFLIDLCRQRENETSEKLKKLNINFRSGHRVKLHGTVICQEKVYDTGVEGKKLGKGVLHDLSEKGVAFHLKETEIWDDFSKIIQHEFLTYIIVDMMGARYRFDVVGNILSCERGIQKGELGDFYILHMKFTDIDRKNRNNFKLLFE